MYRCKALFLSGVGHLCASHILGNAEPCSGASRPCMLLFTHSIQQKHKTPLGILPPASVFPPKILQEAPRLWQLVHFNRCLCKD